MINILFVDDEIEVLNAFKRMLYFYRKEWNQFFASSGKEALSILENNNMDVIISDMKMPEMSGNTLLTEVKNKYPGIVRIILSGQNDEMKNIRSLLAAHQFLTKPCDAEKIRLTIDNSLKLKNLIENEEIINFINSIDTLPILPEIYIEIEQILLKEDFSFVEISEKISNDPALTLKLLQTVNSGFFGLSRRITDLTEALTYLGMNIIKSILIYLKVFSTEGFSKEHIQTISEIGNHSLKTAQIGRAITRREKMNRSVSEDIFIACLLHDIGKLVLIKNPDYFSKFYKLYNNSGKSWKECELELFGFTHESLGAYILGIWGMPKTIIESTAFHHSPSLIEESDISCLTIVHIANSFANFKGIYPEINDLNLDINYIEKHLNLEKIKEWWEIK